MTPSHKSYQNISASGNSRIHNGDVINNYAAKQTEKHYFNTLTPVERGQLLIQAARHRQIRRLELLLETGANPDSQDLATTLPEELGLLGPTALHEAVQNNDIEVIDVLLHHGADINAQAHGGPAGVEDDEIDVDGTPCMWAATLGLINVVECLLRAKADVNACTYATRETALHMAAYRGFDEIVLLLLNNGANIEAELKDGRTPMYYASVGKHPTTTKILAEHKARVDCRFMDQWTPLSIISADETGMPNQEVVQTLLDHGADIETEGKFGLTPLMWCSHLGHLDMVRSILVKGADTEAKPPLLDDGSCSPEKKSISAHYGEVPMLGKNPWYSSRPTALILAACEGHADVVEELLHHGADVYARNDKSRTALMEASQFGRLSVVKKLLRHEANVHCRDEDGSTALHWAARYGRYHVAKYLLTHGADVDQRDAFSRTPLLQCIRHKKSGATMPSLLLDHGANIHAVDKAGDTVLKKAARGRDVDAVRVLLDRGAVKEMPGRKGNTALMDACRKRDNTELVEVLLNSGCNINFINKYRYTPLYNAIRDGFEDVTELLLRRGADVNIRCYNDFTALVLAARRGQTDIVRLLLDYGASIDATSIIGRSALQQAAGRGHREIVEILIRRGAKVDDKSISAARDKGHDSIAELISRHVPKDEVDRSGYRVSASTKRSSDRRSSYEIERVHSVVPKRQSRYDVRYDSQDDTEDDSQDNSQDDWEDNSEDDSEDDAYRVPKFYHGRRSSKQTAPTPRKFSRSGFTSAFKRLLT